MKSVDEKAITQAAIEVTKMSLQTAIEIDPQLFDSLGGKFAEFAHTCHADLAAAHGENLPYLMGITLKVMWFSIWIGVCNFRLMEPSGNYKGVPFDPSCATPEGFSDHFLSALNLAEEVLVPQHENQRKEFRAGTPYAEEDRKDIMDCAALLFFTLAAQKIQEQKFSSSLDWLCEAQTALGLGDRMYAADIRQKDAETGLADELKHFRKSYFSNIGKKGVTTRHGPMNTLKDWSIAKYRAKEWKTASEAAYALQDEIMSHGRTINANLAPQNAVRTIAEWFRKSA